MKIFFFYFYDMIDSSSKNAYLQNLAARIRQGDIGALIPFRKTLLDEGTGYLRKRGMSSADALDTAQEYISLISSDLIRGKAFSQVRAYFFKCLRSKLQKHAQRQERFVPIDPTNETGFAPDANDPVGSFEEREELHYRIQKLMKHFAMLGEGCKSLLKHHFWGQYENMAALAEELGLSNANSAKTRKSDCLKRLREIYFQSSPDSPINTQA